MWNCPTGFNSSSIPRSFHGPAGVTLYCGCLYWMFQFEKKKTLKLGHGCLITLFLCGCNYRSPIPFQVQLHVISASKINQHRVVTGLSCFIITISKSQWYVMIIHMKPGAKKSRPFFYLADQLWCLFCGTYCVATRPLYHAKHDSLPLKQLAENKIACQLWKSKSKKKPYLCMYTINHEYPWFRHGYPYYPTIIDIQNLIMDIHNWIMDIHDPNMHIHNCIKRQ